MSNAVNRCLLNTAERTCQKQANMISPLELGLKNGSEFYWGLTLAGSRFRSCNAL
jgi:hypothetical protein